MQQVKIITLIRAVGSFIFREKIGLDRRGEGDSGLESWSIVVRMVEQKNGKRMMI